MLFCYCLLAETRQCLLRTHVRQLKEPRIQVIAVLSTDDEDPVPASALECVLHQLSFEDASVRLESLGVLRPVDEDLFIELLDWHVHTFVERALRKLLL